ncbi:aminotransferase class V-fold PLP-dependent enzyme [Oscillatoria amoena NRMC-F 0135]|nr:aminotransferase class V-fold PLP-dependent enzyme [Oscillatoria amoena NRMC-F 0135]
MTKINFTPGPSQLYFTAEDHMRKAFRDGIPSLSHRSTPFEKIFSEANHGLRELLGIPQDFYIVYTSSATEIWERIIQNLVHTKSLHYINGAFSKRFHETAIELGKKPEAIRDEEGEEFYNVQDTPEFELIALTHNETSTGVMLPMDFINGFRSRNPNALIAVDAVSSLPYPQFDFDKIDTLFFSVQKGFGLPAGLGVWIVNERCIAKAEELQSNNIVIGSYHSLPSLVSHAKKNQTPETPNVLGIYLLSKVIADMLRRGIRSIRNETDYKAAILYQALKHHAVTKPFVTNEALQSKTVIVAECNNYTEQLSQFLSSKGLQPGDGYGSFKSNHLRFANFPAYSKEQFEMLVDLISTFEP